MSNDIFWQAVRVQLKELERAKSAADVVRILSHDRDPYQFIGGRVGGQGDDQGFFAGSGGDDRVIDSLREAGWRTIWSEAHYHYAMRAPDGKSAITYVEGDIYAYDQRDTDARVEQQKRKDEAKAYAAALRYTRGEIGWLRMHQKGEIEDGGPSPLTRDLVKCEEFTIALNGPTARAYFVFDVDEEEGTEDLKFAFIRHFDGYKNAVVEVPDYEAEDLYAHLASKRVG